MDFACARCILCLALLALPCTRGRPGVWSGAGYPANILFRRRHFWERTGAGVATVAGTSGRRGQGLGAEGDAEVGQVPKDLQGRFFYLLHTAQSTKPGWVADSFTPPTEERHRPVIVVRGLAQQIRHSLYQTYLETIEHDLLASRIEYVVFIDADLVQIDFAELDAFEAFLWKWLPAVGMPFLEPIYGHASWFDGRDAWPWAQWDDAIVAYHTSAAPRLFDDRTTPSWAHLGWAARWRHRVWAMLLFPEHVLLTPNVRLFRKPGGQVNLPHPSLLLETFRELLDVAGKGLGKQLFDTGDNWKAAMLSIVHPQQPYGPVITNGLNAGMPIGCYKCICPLAARGSASEYAQAKPTWIEATTADAMKMHALLQSRIQFAFMERNQEGGLAGVSFELSSRAVLPIEAARRHDGAAVVQARVDFERCMAPGLEDTLAEHDLPLTAQQLRKLPVRDRTHLYVLLIRGPSLAGTCWLEILERSDCSLLVITWKEPLSDPPEVLASDRVTPAYLPKSNIQEAKLSQHWISMEIMLAQGWRFGYVVRADEDACLTWSSELDNAERQELQALHGSAVGAFHDFLDRDRPPVAVVHNVVDASSYFSGPFNRSTGPWDLARPCVLAWDHRFHAVSAEALPFYAFDLALQPLNWNTADASVFYRLNAAFAGRTVSYTEVEMDIRRLKSTSEQYLKVLGDDSILPTVATSWERTWLPLAHRTAVGLPRHLKHRALYSFWLEWETSDGASDCLPTIPPGRSHESLWTAVGKQSSKDVCYSQQQPHLRWHHRYGGLGVVLMMERLITDYLNRLLRAHKVSRSHVFQIAGHSYAAAEVEAAFVRELALHLRVYELVCEEAFDEAWKASNYSKPLSLEVHAQVRELTGGRFSQWFSDIGSLKDAARAFRMDGGRRTDGLPPVGRRPLLMHLQLRAALEAFPAARIAHHDPRFSLPKPQRGQAFFAPLWLIPPYSSRDQDEVADTICHRASVLPVGVNDIEESILAAALCVGGGMPVELREHMNKTAAAALAAAVPSLQSLGMEQATPRSTRCLNWLGLPLGIAASASSPLARAAVCFRELVQGFRFASVVYG